MKSLKFLNAMTLTLLIAACDDNSGPDADDFVGRWSREGATSILTITHVADDFFQVELFYLDAMGHESRDTTTATVEGNIITIGESPFVQKMRLNVETDRLHGQSGAYRPVPEGWEWSDGYDDLDN